MDILQFSLQYTTNWCTLKWSIFLMRGEIQLPYINYIVQLSWSDWIVSDCWTIRKGFWIVVLWLLIHLLLHDKYVSLFFFFKDLLFFKEFIINALGELMPQTSRDKKKTCWPTHDIITVWMNKCATRGLGGCLATASGMAWHRYLQKNKK